MNQKQIENSLKAGQIASQVRQHAKKIIKKGVPLLEIAEQIENKIIELGAKPSFPVNLSINEVAAHYTPSYNDETKAHGLLKVDFGAQVNGWISDTAFSIDLENNEENKELIKASEEALNNAIELIKTKKENITTSEIGAIIQKTIESKKLNPIVNLSGHSMQEFDLHSGITIPNIDDKRNIKIENGLYAIEPFVTSGNGKVYDGKPSGIYILNQAKNVRSPLAREILDFIIKEYQTLPFCSRWIIKKFKTKSLFALKELENNNIISQFDQLIEISHKPVSQTEHSILIEKDKITITTE
jgi:methionyl aminopeptidase